jgi:nucleoid DNA-binding protein
MVLFTLQIYKEQGVKMNYSDFVKNISKRMDLPQTEIKRLLKQNFDTMEKVLDSGKGFTIPGLGTFGVKVKEEHKAYSPFHEKFMLLPKKRVVTYSPSSVIKEELKDRRVDND